MRSLALAALVVTVGACSDAVSGNVRDPHPGSAISATVGRDGGVVRTPNGYAAVEIPAGALGQDVVVTLERVNTRFATGRGPLRTKHVQYGAAYRVTMSPEPILSRTFTVALCAGEGQTFQGPDEVHHRLRYAISPLDPGAGQLEESVTLFAPGGGVRNVNCAARAAAKPGALERLFAAIGPKEAWAIDLGGGGEGYGGCTHLGCSMAATPFRGLVIGVIDPGALAK